MPRALGEKQLQPLLQTLSDGRWHSGESLAGHARITRAALNKRLRRLEELGLTFDTKPGQGCRLQSPLELLDADLVRGHLPAEWRKRITVRTAFSTGSTNADLLDADPGDDPQAVVAEHQQAGRGRRGRAWHSPFGANLYLSLAWTFPHWPPQVTALPLVGGTACADALADANLAPFQLKWPNDLVHEGRKLGGILIEQRGEAGSTCRVVIGVGLNVEMQRDVDIDQPWTCLREMNPAAALSRNVLASQILMHLAQALEPFGTEGFAPFAGRWKALDSTYRRRVTVDTGTGKWSGRAMGVEPDGALRIDSADGQRHLVRAGDVSLRTTRDD